MDCSELKTLLNGSDGLRSSIGGLCFDIIELGWSFFISELFGCIEANSVAHHCASMVSATERSFFWLDYIPDWLLGLAVVDCTHVID